MVKKPAKPKVVLPGLELNRIEFDLLQGLAAKEGLSMGDYLELLVRQAIELDDETDGKIVVVQIPHKSYEAFAAWVLGGTESAEDAIARFVDLEGQRLAELQSKLGKGNARK